MLKSSIIAVLMASLALLVSEIITTCNRDDITISETSASTGTAPSLSQAGLKIPRRTYSSLPDLNEGYLFNAERSLAEGAGYATETEMDVPPIDMNEVRYIGSIIGDGQNIGIISFPVSTVKVAATGAGRTRKRLPAPPREQRFAHLSPGADFKGYTVSAIQADKIVFTKNGEEIEKSLYDPAKERIIITPPPKRAKKRPRRRANLRQANS